MKKIAIIACAALAVTFILDSAGIRTAAANGIEMCLTSVIPSLFAFMALSSFVMSSGIVKGDKSLFILSMAGGYPVGAKLLSDRIAANPQNTKLIQKSENMLMYCYCGSPAFIMAIVPPALGLYVWLSNVLACLIFCAFYVFKNKIDRYFHVFKNKKDSATGETSYEIENTKRIENSKRIENTKNLGQSLVNSVTSTGSALYKVCLMVITFAVIIRILEFFGIMQLLPTFVYPFLEITNLVKIGNFANSAPGITAALTSMGGICVLFQVWVIIRNSGANIRLYKFILARIPIAILSGLLCRIIIGFTGLYGNSAVFADISAANTRVAVSAGGSKIASACLMVMTLILLSSCHRNYNTQKQKSPSSYK